ncbi:MAG: M56 family metallopeptidase, partial [Bacteroidota bacterium]
TRRVKCYLSNKAGEVMTLGFWSPVIVFPVALVNELSPEMARTILLHELAHLRHYDHWLNYPQQFLKIFFFYHPAAHAICQLIDQEREHRCDDWVAGNCADRRTYASALVTVARTSHIPPNKLVMSATKTHFTTRIQRLFLGEQRQKDHHFTFSILLFILLGGGHLGFAYLGEDAGAADCLGEQKALLTSIPYLSDTTPLGLVTGQAKKCNEPTYLISTWDHDAPQPPAANDSRSWDRYERAVEKYEEKRFSDNTPRELMAISEALATPVLLSTPHGEDNRPVIISTETIKALPLPASLNMSTSLPTLLAIKRPCPTVDTVPPSTKSELKFESVKDGAKIIIHSDQGDDDKQPVIFLNGERYDGDAMNEIDPKDIATIHVLKKDEDLKRLGLQGSPGVIRITTKGHRPTQAEKELFPEVKHIDTEDKGKLHLELPEDMKAAYFLNDERSDAATVRALDRDLVDRVEVIKRESAVKAMDLEGFDAVIMVYTKK